MSEKQKETLERIADALAPAKDEDLKYILGYAEGMADMRRQQEQAKPSDQAASA